MKVTVNINGKDTVIELTADQVQKVKKATETALETENSFKYVWDKCSGILFLQGRPHFHYIDGSKAKANCGCTICLVSYGEENLNSLILYNLGKVVVQK